MLVWVIYVLKVVLVKFFGFDFIKIIVLFIFFDNVFLSYIYYLVYCVFRDVYFWGFSGIGMYFIV